MYGGNKKDTINGANGNDTIVGGKGNDYIIGGKGTNKVIYNNGNGFDTIKLTKGEKLNIVLDPNYDASGIKYQISKNDLLIKYNGTNIISLKNFGKTDIPGSKGKVKLFVGDTFVNDLRKDAYLPAYKSFTTKKPTYTGTWRSEIITAAKYVKPAIQNNTGVKINAAGGNDIITGSTYNDTINGGAGNDQISGGRGTNKINGGKGSDTYNLFNNVTREKTTINDTGKGSSVDTALIYTNKEDLQLWFNIDRSGKITQSFNVQTKDGSGNNATLKGVEVIKSVKNGETYNYDYKSDALRQEVTAWLNGKGHKYSDVATAFTKATVNQQNELIAIFNKDDYWTPST